MSVRFFAKKQLVFAVGGRALSRGNPMGHSGSGGFKEYKQLIRMAAKFAMKEQGWELTDKGLYMAITIFLVPSEPDRLHYKPNVEKLKNDKVFAIKSPYTERMATIVTNSLKGLVFKTNSQIIGLTVIKAFAKDPRIEVLIGEPESFKEMLYDLRNA